MPLRGVHTRMTDDAFDSGYLEEGQNLLMEVNGELRRRPGILRSSIAKKTAQVDNLAGFLAFDGEVMVMLADGDRLQGYEDPEPTETDLTLYAPTGTFYEFDYQQWHVMVVRGQQGNFDIDGFEVFAKVGSAPISASEGGVVSAGFIPIDRNSYVAQGYWYGPSAGAWKFSARAVKGGVVGPLGSLDLLSDTNDVDQDANGNWPEWQPKRPPDLPPVGDGGGDPAADIQPAALDDPNASTPQWSSSGNYYMGERVKYDVNDESMLRPVGVITIGAGDTGTVASWTMNNSEGTSNLYAIVTESDGQIVDSGTADGNYTLNSADTYIFYYGSLDVCADSDEVLNNVDGGSFTIGNAVVTLTANNGTPLSRTLHLSSTYLYNDVATSWTIDCGTLADDEFFNFTDTIFTTPVRTNAADAWARQTAMDEEELAIFDDASRWNYKLRNDAQADTSIADVDWRCVAYTSANAIVKFTGTTESQTTVRGGGQSVAPGNTTVYCNVATSLGYPDVRYDSGTIELGTLALGSATASAGPASRVWIIGPLTWTRTDPTP